MTDNETQEKEAPDREKSRWGNFLSPENIKSILAVGAAAISTLTFFVMFFGFVVVNAHLIQHGFYDTNIFSPVYIPAGFIFLAFFLIYCLLPGRAIFSAIERLSFNLEEIEHGNFHKIIAFIENYTHIGFQMILATFVFAIFFLDETSVVFVTQGLALYFFVSFCVLDRMKESRRASIFKVYADLFMQMVVITAFVVNGIFYSELYSIFGIFFVAMFLFNFILDHIEKKKITRGGYFYSALLLLLLLLSSAVSFGTFIYGNIGPNIGGGRGAKVEVLFKNESNLCKNLSGCENGKILSNVFHIGDEFIYLSSEGKAYKIKAEEISMISGRLRQEGEDINSPKKLSKMILEIVDWIKTSDEEGD